MNQRLVNIIKSYKRLRAKKPDNHLKHYENPDSLENAIYYAATALTTKAKGMDIKDDSRKSTFIKYVDNLTERIKDIKKVKTFDKLYKITADCANKGHWKSCHGIGSLDRDD